MNEEILFAISFFFVHRQFFIRALFDESISQNDELNANAEQKFETNSI